MCIGIEEHTCSCVFNFSTATHGLLKLHIVTCRDSCNVVVVTPMKVRDPMLVFCDRVDQLKKRRCPKHATAIRQRKACCELAGTSIEQSFLHKRERKLETR